MLICIAQNHSIFLNKKRAENICPFFWQIYGKRNFILILFLKSS